MPSPNYGVSSVRATLERSLIRAQRRFNLSNPVSDAKEKLLKERLQKRNLQKKLRRLTKLYDLNTYTQNDWTESIPYQTPVEFEPALDSYSDFVKSIKEPLIGKYYSTRSGLEFTPISTITELSSKVKLRKKEAKKVKKWTKILKKQEEKELKKQKKKETLGIPIIQQQENGEVLVITSGDEDTSPVISTTTSQTPQSKLERLRLKRLEKRKRKKELKRLAKERRLEETKLLENTVNEEICVVKENGKLKKKKLKMKDQINLDEETKGSSHDLNSLESDSGSNRTMSLNSLNSNHDAIGKLTFSNGNGNGISTSPIKKKIVEPPQIPNPKVMLFKKENVLRGWRTRYATGCGFINLGNSCYMNATLQALFHIPSFAQWLLTDDEHRSQCQRNGLKYQNCMICAMYLTLKESLNQSSCMRPMQIYNRLRMISKNFVHGRQEDAHEFLRYLLESMENSYLSACGASKLDPRSKETNPLGQIFGGYLRTEVTCLKCTHVSTTFQYTAELQLDIRHATTVEDAISFHFRREKVDNNDYRCEKCKILAPVTKQFTLEVAPTVLCLQLKRFTLFGGKLSKPVHCNKYLDLTPYLHKSIRSDNHAVLKYQLVGLITHIGSSPNGGHYTAIADAPNGNMYQFDDSYVRSVLPHTALNTDAYVIIYEMKRPQEGKSQSSSSSVSSVGTPSSISSQIRGNPSTIACFQPQPKSTPSFLSPQKPKVLASPFTHRLPTTEKFTNPFKTPVVSKEIATDDNGISPNSCSLRATSPHQQSTITSIANERSPVVCIKPRSERLPVSFSMKTTSDTGGSKSSPFARNPTSKPNGIASKSVVTPLVPYENDDSEEGTPIRERSKTPTSRADSKSRDVDANRKFEPTLASAPIKTWEDTNSHLSESVKLERKRALEKSETDLYNEEFDIGRVKKRKEHRSKSRDPAGACNKFQKYEDNRRLVTEKTKNLNLDTIGSSSMLMSSSTPNEPQRNHHQPNSTPSEHRNFYISQNSQQQSPESYQNHSRDNYFSRKGYNNTSSTPFRRYNSIPSSASSYHNNRNYNNNNHFGGNGGNNYRGGGGGRSHHHHQQQHNNNNNRWNRNSGGGRNGRFNNNKFDRYDSFHHR